MTAATLISVPSFVLLSKGYVVGDAGLSLNADMVIETMYCTIGKIRQKIHNGVVVNLTKVSNLMMTPVIFASRRSMSTLAAGDGVPHPAGWTTSRFSSWPLENP